MGRLLESEIFVSVVDEGTFTAAATRLKMDKSYVSRMVTRLEDRLGVRLLHRTTRSLKLTEPGQAYYERSAEALRFLLEAEVVASEHQSTPSGRLRLAVPSTFGTSFLSEMLVEFKVRYPKICLEVSFSNRRVDILAERFDVAIRIGDLPDSALIARKLASVTQGICGSPEYLQERGEPLHPQQLADHECLMFEHDNVAKEWRLSGPDGPVRVRVQGSMITNDGSLLAAAAARGMGLVFLPEFHTQGYLRRGELRSVLPSFGVSKEIHALYPYTRHVPTKIRLLVDFMRASLDPPAWVASQDPERSM